TPAASARGALRTRASNASGVTLRRAPRDSSAERVAGAAHRLDQTRTAAGLELVTQVLDAHIDEVRIPEIVEPPNLLQDLFSRQDLPRMPQEQLQQVVLARGQLEELAVAVRF